MKIKCSLKEIRMVEKRIETKSEFARELGVEVHTYIKWENGDSSPTLITALEIAKKLNRRVEDIWHLE